VGGIYGMVSTNLVVLLLAVLSRGRARAFWIVFAAGFVVLNRASPNVGYPPMAAPVFILTAAVILIGISVNLFAIAQALRPSRAEPGR
jgi:hypothetical protein